jgi:uncharacterized protein
MAHVDVHADAPALDDPVLVEGLPGVGLVGKIAADHLVDHFEMDYYAACRCSGLPDAAVYHAGDATVRPPVRLYADGDRDLFVLQSDVPVSPQSAEAFAGCLTGWIQDNGVTPLYLSGLPSETAAEEADAADRSLYGVATGDAGPLLETHDVAVPDENGLISGPTGALLHHAGQEGLDAVGLVVESNPNFPDPEAARTLLSSAIAPIAGIEVDTTRLSEQAERIGAAREELARRMREATAESSQATPIGMYQ